MPIGSSSNSDRLEAGVQAARDQLARLEQERADLILELDEFEQLYTARVGPIQARLEVTQLHVAEYRLRIELVRLRGRSLSPSQLEAEVGWQLREQRQHAQSTFASAEQAQRAQATASTQAQDAVASLDLKQVYRELAKRVHPDLAGDPSERDDRSRQMIQVNDLYARRELGELKQLLRKVRGEQSRRAENPRQRRMRLKDEQTRLEASIKRLKAELAELNHSPMMALKLECALARSRGRDVLAEMAVQMTAQLEEAEGELSALIQTFRELAESSGLADNG